MYDCFNMACHDNSNALQLHIKVNSENLLPVSQKYNIGSLRVPADPSWPKIPQRKLAEDNGDIIEHPCVVTLTGTPRRSRTVVETPLCQSIKSGVIKDDVRSSLHRERCLSSTHTLKKRPGCIDPRFKKVTNVKSQVTSTESLQQEQNALRETSRSALVIPTEQLRSEEIDKSIPERDMNTQQVTMHEAEKPDDINNTKNIDDQIKIHEFQSFGKTNEPIKDTKTVHNSSISRESNSKENECIHNAGFKSLNKVSDEAICENGITERHKCINNSACYHQISDLKTSVNDANIQAEITSTTQEASGQLFFLVEKPVQSHPINTIHVDSISIPRECTKQCYNVQVPVLTYQNIPLQISTNNENVSLAKIPENCLPDSCKAESLPKKLILTPCPAESKTDKIPLNPNIPEKLKNSEVQTKRRESSDSEYYLPTTLAKYVHVKNSSRSKYTKVACATTDEETTDSEIAGSKKNCGESKIAPKNGNENRQQTPRFVFTAEREQSRKDCNSVICETRSKNKSVENLPCVGKECGKRLLRSSEPYITFKQKRAVAKFSRKTRSHFQKNSHPAIVDSDYSLVLPNCQYAKRKRSQQNLQKFHEQRLKKLGRFSTIKLSKATVNKVARANVENNPDFVVGDERKILQRPELCQETLNSFLDSSSQAPLEKDDCKPKVTPRTNTEDTIEKPKGISLKTQELLNKSYWEYYNKLKHEIENKNNTQGQRVYQLVADDSKIKRTKPEEVHAKDLKNQTKLSPELQTLEQCSALSTMINKALDSTLQSSDIVQTKQLYHNGNMKSSSDPTAGTQSAVVKQINSYLPGSDDCNAGSPVPVNKSKRKREKRDDKQFIELKTIVFFGSMMYILIIFMPMLYDYFYHEEYDDYENLSYAEIILEYILSSFKEAFGGLFDGLRKIFLHPRACKRCNSV